MCYGSLLASAFAHKQMFMKHTFALLIIAAAVFALLSCEYTFPLTEPTQPVEKRVVGDYTSATPERQWLKIRPLDENHYIVVHDGTIFRAHHSEVDGMALVSLENLDDGTGKWTYLCWQLSDGGKTLTVRNVAKAVLPYETANAAAARKLLTVNRRNPELFGAEMVFRRN